MLRYFHCMSLSFVIIVTCKGFCLCLRLCVFHLHLCLPLLLFSPQSWTSEPTGKLLKPVRIRVTKKEGDGVFQLIGCRRPQKEKKKICTYPLKISCLLIWIFHIQFPSWGFKNEWWASPTRYTLSLRCPLTHQCEAATAQYVLDRLLIRRRCLLFCTWFHLFSLRIIT